MPKIPGRKSTRKTIPLERATIANFLMPWDRLVAKNPCCIDGCDHVGSGQIGDLGSREFCGDGMNASSIYDEALMPGPVPDPYVGIACPCCTRRIMEVDRPTHGSAAPPGTGDREGPPF